jgi:hypothetical protein
MRNLTVSVPHQLTRDEARQRIQAGIAQARREHGSLLENVQEAWSRDRLDFAVSAAGQHIKGFLVVEERAVQIEVELPWLLAMLGNAVKEQLERQGGRLLRGPQPS